MQETLPTHVTFGETTFKLHGHNGEYIQEIVSQWGLWEPRITRVVVQLMESAHPDDGIVIDCGAHIGYYSMLAASFGYRVVAIEPVFHQEIREAAIQNHLEQFIEVMPIALGNQLGECDMRVYHHTGLTQVIASPGEAPSQWHQQVGGGVIREVSNIPMVTLDSIVSDSGPILILKVDVEGLEPEVLRGFLRGLESRQAANLLVEFTPLFLGVDVCLELAKEICAHGYDVYDLGIFESGHYEPLDLLSGIEKLSDEALQEILLTQRQTNFLFRRQ